MTAGSRECACGMEIYRDMDRNGKCVDGCGMTGLGKEELDAVLGKLGVDAAIVTDPVNVRYVSGFRGGEAVLYITGSDRILITDSRYTEAAGRESDFTVVEWDRNRTTEAIVGEYVAEGGIKSLAYEDKVVTCEQFGKLRKMLPDGLELVEAGPAWNELRQVKKPWEIDNLRKAESIGDAAFESVLKVLRPGISELDVVAELEYQMRRHGGEGTSFDTIVASGLHSSMPHAIPDRKLLENGDFVTMDFGCRYNGYCSDMTRTVVLGRADDRQKEIYGIVLKANLMALEAVHAGLKGCEVDSVARDYIESMGYGKCFGHGLGHGVGLYIHENPRFSPGDSTVLEVGMIETVEPGIYVPGFGGVRIEDMIVITADGHENLSHSTKELIEL